MSSRRPNGVALFCKGDRTRSIRFALGILFLGSFAISQTTCVGPLALNGIVIAPANPTIPAGATQQFTATGYYNDQTSHDITTEVTWTSSNTSVATVNSSGLATAIGQGITTITATSSIPNSANNSISYGSTILTVNAATLSSLTVTPVNPSTPVGAFQTFTATGTFNNGTSVDLTNLVVWSSSDTSVATIEEAGLALAVSVGTATITATSGSISASATLTVNTATLSSLAVTPSNPSIPVGVPLRFTATGTYSDGTTFATHVTWNSSDTSVATIDSTGVALAVSAGTVTITATSIIDPSISGNAFLTVNSATLSSLAVTPATATILVGASLQFMATGTYSDGTSFDITTEVAWSSSNSSVASIGTNGVALAVSAGTATITATSLTNTPGISGSAAVTVTTIPLVFITVTPADATIPLLSTIQFKATGTYSDGTTNDITTQVAWSSSNSSAASIDSRGLVTTNFTAGITTITATSGSVSGSTTLRVGLQ